MMGLTRCYKTAVVFLHFVIFHGREIVIYGRQTKDIIHDIHTGKVNYRQREIVMTWYQRPIINLITNY